MSLCHPLSSVPLPRRLSNPSSNCSSKSFVLGTFCLAACLLAQCYWPHKVKPSSPSTAGASGEGLTRLAWILLMEFWLPDAALRKLTRAPRWPLRPAGPRRRPPRVLFLVSCAGSARQRCSVSPSWRQFFFVAHYIHSFIPPPPCSFSG